MARIVVADDYEDTLGFVSTVLEQAGHDVRTARDGRQALVLLHERPAELLITDIFMPGQEGFATVSRCRRERPETKIIVMSAGTVPGMKHDFLAAAELLGAGATLRKPFTADELLSAVGKVLL